MNRAGQLDSIRTRALANRVRDVEILSAAEVAALEPAVRCTAGLFSPSTGIVDSHSLMLALQGDLEAAGSSVGFLSELTEGRRDGGRFRLRVNAAGTVTEVGARCLINAAGLNASRIARRITGLDPRHVPDTRFAKGNYFVYRAKHPFRHLVYPLPEPDGLGIHVTLDLGGQARFGPDVEWVDEPEYGVDGARAGRFFQAIRGYWPDVRLRALAPGYARGAAQARRARRSPGGFSDPRARGPRPARTGEPLRHRITGTHRFTGDCRTRLRPAGSQGPDRLTARLRRITARRMLPANRTAGPLETRHRPMTPPPQHAPGMHG